MDIIWQDDATDWRTDMSQGRTPGNKSRGRHRWWRSEDNTEWTELHIKKTAANGEMFDTLPNLDGADYSLGVLTITSSRLTRISWYQNVSILDFTGTKDNNDNWSMQKLQSNRHQQTNTDFFTGRMPVPSASERCQTTERNMTTTTAVYYLLAINCDILLSSWSRHWILLRGLQAMCPRFILARDCVRSTVPMLWFLPHAGLHLATAHFWSQKLGHGKRYRPVSSPRHLSLHSGDFRKLFYSSNNCVYNINYCLVVLKCTTLILANWTELNWTEEHQTNKTNAQTLTREDDESCCDSDFAGGGFTSSVFNTRLT